MIKWFLPAPIRAYLYIKDMDFRHYLYNWYFYSGHPTRHKAHMAGTNSKDICHLSLLLELKIPSLLLIRRNSEAEKQFNTIEAMYFTHKLKDKT